MELRVKSATYAMKGKQILQQHGIRAHVNKRSGESGCFYYLNVLEKDLDAARSILQESGVLK